MVSQLGGFRLRVSHPSPPPPPQTYQGGATTFTRNLRFLQTGYPYISEWSWGHQGVFQDTDGSLINAQNIPPELVANASFPLGQPNMTWHSAVESTLFDPAECVYVYNSVISNQAAFCSNRLVYRRVMLNQHTPPGERGAGSAGLWRGLQPHQSPRSEIISRGWERAGCPQ